MERNRSRPEQKVWGGVDKQPVSPNYPRKKTELDPEIREAMKEVADAMLEIPYAKNGISILKEQVRKSGSGVIIDASKRNTEIWAYIPPLHRDIISSGNRVLMDSVGNIAVQSVNPVELLTKTE